MILNLFIGVLMPVGLFSYKNTINEIFQRGGQGIIGGDLKVSSRVRPKEESLLVIDEYLKDEIVSKSEIKSMFSMGQASGKVGMLNLMTVTGNYPYYGKVETQKGIGLHDIKDFEILVKPEVLLKFGVVAGDKIEIGGALFTIVDIITKDVNEGMQLAQMAPKVYVTQKAIKDIGLISQGSTVFYSYVYRLKKELGHDSYKSLKEQVLDSNIRLTRASSANDMFSRSLNIVFDFSQIIFLCGILISVSAFSYIYRYFLKKESSNILSYRILGLEKKSIYLIYLLHGFLSLLLTFIMSYFVSYLVSPLAISLLSKYSTVDISGLTLSIPFGFLSILSLFLFTIIITFVHSTIEDKQIRLVYLVGPLISLVLLVYYQTNSITIAPSLVGFLLILLLAFYYLIPLLISPLLKIKQTFFNLAMLSLVRNKTTTISKFYILFITFFVINIVPIVFMSISKDIEVGKGSRPDYFVFDIQEDQFEPLNQYLIDKEIQHSSVSPMIRGRLVSINDEEVRADASEKSNFEEEQRNRALNRGVNISYDNTLNSAERVIKGKYFSKSSNTDGINEVSLETRYAKRIGVEVGDKITFEIFDINFETIVTSIRSVKWTSFLPNFFIVFEDGILNDAPKTYLTTLSNVSSYSEIVKLVDHFKSLSIVDIKEMTGQAQKFLTIVEKILINMVIVFLIISILSFITLTIFSIKISQADNQLLKYLGVSYEELLKLRLFEFLFLCLISTFLALSLAFLLGYIIVEVFLGISFSFSSIALTLNLIPFVGVVFYNKKSLGY